MSKLLQFFVRLMCSVAAVSFAVGLNVGRAEVTYVETIEAERDVTVIRMSVTPAAQPVPALKYRLTMREIDLEPGNAATYYYRVFNELTREMRHRREKFDEETELAKWYATGPDATPIAELPLVKLRAAALEPQGWLYSQLREACSRRECDWGLGVEEIRGVELIAFLLEEFQQSRELARMLLLQTRLDIAESRFEAAIDSLRTMYRLAIDVARVPFLVNGLIAIAEANMANGAMIELIAAPESPNMYWALSELPSPLVDLRRAARFEMEFGLRMFPFLQGAETTDRSPEEWNRLYTQSFRDLATVGEGGVAQFSKTGAGLVATANALANYSYAKRQLIAQGMDRGEVEAMAVGQVMAIYTERNYTQFADDFEKLWYVPFPEMRARYGKIEKRLSGAKPFSGGEQREVLPVVDLLLPATQAARTAQVRLERDVAALQVIEALRMYAATHAGGLPQSLAEIREVPVPLNPATERAFVYRLEGATAVLELPDSDGIPGYQRRFEITIAGKN